jgi:putative membrane protein
MFKKIIIGILINGLALFAICNLLDNIYYTGGWKFFLVGGLIIGILNTLVKPVIKTITLPLVILTAGLFLIVINTIILWLTSYVIKALEFSGMSFQIVGLGTFLIAGFLFGLINWIENLIIKK